MEAKEVLRSLADLIMPQRLYYPSGSQESRTVETREDEVSKLVIFQSQCEKDLLTNASCIPVYSTQIARHCVLLTTIIQDDFIEESEFTEQGKTNPYIVIRGRP